jgi:hypothetical protein
MKHQYVDVLCGGHPGAPTEQHDLASHRPIRQPKTGGSSPDVRTLRVYDGRPLPVALTAGILAFWRRIG